MQEGDTPALAPLQLPAIADLAGKEKKKKRKKEDKPKALTDKPPKKKRILDKDGQLLYMTFITKISVGISQMQF